MILLLETGLLISVKRARRPVENQPNPPRLKDEYIPFEAMLIKNGEGVKERYTGSFVSWEPARVPNSPSLKIIGNIGNIENFSRFIHCYRTIFSDLVKKICFI